MGLDINTKAVARNAFRITSKRAKTCLRVRVPGGYMEARHLEVIQKIAQQYGEGTVYLTSRQGFEIPGISFKDIPAVNKALQPVIEAMEIAIGVRIEQPEMGYPAAGTRNVSACIGNHVCPFANLDTRELAMKIERVVFPNHYHLKIAIAGCPNDCVKAHMHDFGIMGLADTEFDAGRCIGCEACAKNCKVRATGALTIRKNKPVRDESICISCGECALKCPMGAWSRSPVKYFRLLVFGRTGRKNPRLAAPFLEWVTEEALLQVIRNAYSFIEQHIDRTLPKEHLGYIVDRVGYETFKQVVLEGVELGEKARVASTLKFAGYVYREST